MKVNVINKNGALYLEKLCTNVYFEVFLSGYICTLPGLYCLVTDQIC